MTQDSIRLAVRWAEAARVMAYDLANLDRALRVRSLAPDAPAARVRLVRAIPQACATAWSLAHGREA